MYRLRESDIVQFLLYLNVTKAIIVPVKEGGLSLQMGDTKKCYHGQKEEGEEEKEDRVALQCLFTPSGYGNKLL